MTGSPIRSDPFNIRALFGSCVAYSTLCLVHAYYLPQWLNRRITRGKASDGRYTVVAPVTRQVTRSHIMFQDRANWPDGMRNKAYLVLGQVAYSGIGHLAR